MKDVGYAQGPSTDDLVELLSGIITVLNTPFTETGQLDEPALRANVQRALRAGVTGFLVPAMASEVDRLSADERRRMVSLVLSESVGAAIVIGGASAPTQPERLNRAGELVELGCDVVLVALSYRDDASYSRDIHELAESVNAPLMIQDWDPTGYGAPTALVARLFRSIPSFVSLKVEVVPSGPKYSELLEATGGELHVAGGWAVGQMIEALDRGVHSFMPTGMHEIYGAIYRLYRAGRRNEAVNLFRRVLPVLAFSNQHLDISIRFFKRLLWREGLFSTPTVREPRLAFDEVHLRTADELIEVAIKLSRELVPET